MGERDTNSAVAIATIAVVSALLGLYASVASSIPIEVHVVLIAIPAMVLVFMSTPAFVFVFLTIATNIYGFVDLDRGSRSSGLPLHDIIFSALLVCHLLGALVRSRSIAPGAVGRAGGRFIVGVLGLTAIWVAYSCIAWNQPLWVSVKAGKDLLYFAIALSLLPAGLSEAQVKWSVRAVVIVAVLSALVTIFGLFVVLKDLLPGATIYVPQGVSFVRYYRSFTPCFFIIYIAFFILLFDEGLFSRRVRMALLLTIGLAVILLGFRAMWIGIVGALGWLLVFDRQKTVSFWATIRRFGFAGACVLAAVLGTGASNFVVQRVSVISEDLGSANRSSEVLGSLGSRLFQIRGLMKIVAAHPVMGAGFIHPEGEAGFVARQVGLKSVATNDVGWIDILVKLGALGSLALAILMLRWLRALRDTAEPNIQRLALAVRGYFIAGIFALPGAAPFTFQGCVVPLAVTIGVLMAASRPQVPTGLS